MAVLSIQALEFIGQSTYLYQASKSDSILLMQDVSSWLTVWALPTANNSGSSQTLQDWYLLGLITTHDNARVYGVVWDWHPGGCPGSLAPFPVTLSPVQLTILLPQAVSMAIGISQVLSRCPALAGLPQTPYISCEHLAVGWTVTTHKVLSQCFSGFHFSSNIATSKPVHAIVLCKCRGQRGVIGVFSLSYLRFRPLLLCL